MANTLKSFNKILSVVDKTFINSALKIFKYKSLSKVTVQKVAKNGIFAAANIPSLKPTKQSVSANYIELNNACRTQF